MTTQATEAFNTLKKALIDAPILAMPDFSKPFVVETDASGAGLGAVLLQDSHPIAYYSQVLGVKSRSKPVYKKELMAIVLAVKKWRHYLMGRHFLVRTTHELCILSSSWSVPLEELDNEITADSFIQQVITDIRDGGKHHVGYIYY